MYDVRICKAREPISHGFDFGGHYLQLLRSFHRAFHGRTVVRVSITTPWFVIAYVLSLKYHQGASVQRKLASSMQII